MALAALPFGTPSAHAQAPGPDSSATAARGPRFHQEVYVNVVDLAPEYGFGLGTRLTSGVARVSAEAGLGRHRPELQPFAAAFAARRLAGQFALIFPADEETAFGAYIGGAASRADFSFRPYVPDATGTILVASDVRASGTYRTRVLEYGLLARIRPTRGPWTIELQGGLIQGGEGVYADVPLFPGYQQDCTPGIFFSDYCSTPELLRQNRRHRFTTPRVRLSVGYRLWGRPGGG